MKFPDLAARIIELKEADLRLREKLLQEGALSEGYHPEMEALHNRNARLLAQIMDAIGYPTIEKVGEAASEAAWLIIQHAISQPEFMRRSRTLLEAAVDRKEAHPRPLAYLTDRIAVFEGNPQLYGTQFDWDAHGKLSPRPFDNLARVNQRRAAVGLNTLEEQTEIMRRRAEKENQRPPHDPEERRYAYDAWRKKVGWIS